MKRIIISCINYNSYNELYDYLASIDTASHQAADACEVVVVVADNSLVKQSVDVSRFGSIRVLTYQVDNIGYMGSSQRSLELFGVDKVREFDFLIVSNVDLRIGQDFFTKLSEIDTSGIGWLVNREYTPKIRKEENPMYINRLSATKLKCLKLLYTFPFLNGIYERFVSPLRGRDQIPCNSQNVYAGHGSLMIFTKEMMEKCFPFNFPLFLYGEEIFLAELVSKSGLKARYYPDLYVENIGSVSTGKLIQTQKCKYLKESIEMILDRFYK